MKYHKEIIINKGENSLLIISGVHGNETNAIYQSMLLRDLILNNMYSFNFNKITFLIGLNEYGIINNIREYGRLYDSNDFRLFYDDVDIKEILLLSQEIDNHNIVVDLHNRENIQTSLLFNNDEYTEGFINLVKNKIPYIVWNEDEPTIKNYVNSHKDKIGFTFEINNMGINFNNEDSSLLYNFIKVLNNLNKDSIYDIKIKRTINEKNLSKIITTQNKGILEFVNKGIGYYVNKDEVFAILLNYDGKIIEEIKSPYYGYIMDKPNSFFCSNGYICRIQEV